jgi:hypothetical protein
MQQCKVADLIGFCTEQVNTGKKIAKNCATAKNEKTAYYAVLRYKPGEGAVPQTTVMATTEFNEISDKILGAPHQRYIKLDSPRAAHHNLAKEVAMLLKHGKSVPPTAQQKSPRCAGNFFYPDLWLSRTSVSTAAVRLPRGQPRPPKCLECKLSCSDFKPQHGKGLSHDMY